MNYLLSAVLLLCLSNSFGYDEEQISKQITELNLKSKDFINRFKQEIINAFLDVAPLRKNDAYTADITNYTEEILEHIRHLILEQGLDPLQLPDEEIDLLISGDIKLTNGWLEDLSTIGVYQTVEVNYNSTTKIFDLTLPLSFEELLITYNYKTKVLLITIAGDVKAKISNFKLNLHLGFNFETYQAFVDKIDVKDSGSIKIEFTGLGLLDWIIDSMNTVLTTLFHRIILGVVNAVIQIPVQHVVDDINEIIYDFLHPNATTAVYY